MDNNKKIVACNPPKPDLCALSLLKTNSKDDLMSFCIEDDLE